MCVRQVNLHDSATLSPGLAAWRALPDVEEGEEATTPRPRPGTPREPGQSVPIAVPGMGGSGHEGSSAAPGAEGGLEEEDIRSTKRADPMSLPTPRTLALLADENFLVRLPLPPNFLARPVPRRVRAAPACTFVTPPPPTPLGGVTSACSPSRRLPLPAVPPHRLRIQVRILVRKGMSLWRRRRCHVLLTSFRIRIPTCIPHTPLTQTRLFPGREKKFEVGERVEVNWSSFGYWYGLYCPPRW